MAIHELKVKTTLAKEEYEITGVLGRGGFGITYRAVDKNLGNQVAIKEYAPEDFSERILRGDSGESLAIKPFNEEEYKWGLDRFREEGRTLARFANSANIVSVLRIFDENDTVYLVMEFIDGPNIGEFSSAVTSPSQVEDLFTRLANDLKRMHEAGFIHRDLKPENILIRSTNGEPVLIDFGSSRQQTADRTMALVTPYYSPVEQYASDTPHGPFTDIYSLSATFYKVITGNAPPDAPSRILDDKCKSLSGDSSLSGYSTKFLANIDVGMRPLPGDRPQSIEEWLEQKASIVEAPSDSSSEQLNEEPLRKPETQVIGQSSVSIQSVFSDSGKLKWILGGGITLALVVGLIGLQPDKKKSVIKRVDQERQVASNTDRDSQSVNSRSQEQLKTSWVVGIDGQDWTPIDLPTKLLRLPKGAKYDIRFDAEELFRVKTDRGLALASSPGRNYGEVDGEVYLKSVGSLPQSVRVEIFVAPNL
jgi:serine/threonine protein kinase